MRNIRTIIALVVVVGLIATFAHPQGRAFASYNVRECNAFDPQCVREGCTILEVLGYGWLRVGCPGDDTSPQGTHVESCSFNIDETSIYEGACAEQMERCVIQSMYWDNRNRVVVFACPGNGGNTSAAAEVPTFVQNKILAMEGNYSEGFVSDSYIGVWTIQYIDGIWNLVQTEGTKWHTYSIDESDGISMFQQLDHN